MVEKGYIGSGNVGRNTTIVRSNYMIDGNTQFFEHSMKLWEGLSHALNFNVMMSHRGQIVLAHSPGALDVLGRRGNTMRLNGIDAELLEREDVMKLAPYLDFSKEARFPIWGGLIQHRAGTARHDAVAWGYARGADQQRRRHSRALRGDGHRPRGQQAPSVSTPRGDGSTPARSPSRWPAIPRMSRPWRV